MIEYHGAVRAVEVLGKLIHKRFFPDLWQTRNELTGLAG